MTQRDPQLRNRAPDQAEHDRPPPTEAIGQLTAEQPRRDRRRAEDRDDQPGLGQRRAELDRQHHTEERQRERTDLVDRPGDDQDPDGPGEATPSRCGNDAHTEPP